jgi:2-polyprenyl-6-methoxyphenol hydroxylase-like FAD-dependent oxidoreductase
MDHFSSQVTNPHFWAASSTSVVHLPQNKFEHILRENLNELNKGNSTSESLFGYDVCGLQRLPDGVRMVVKPVGSGAAQTQTIECDYLIGADGSNSKVRRHLGIEFTGEEAIQTLINVHFRCAGLADLLQPRPAMLYFTFNEVSVAVFVAHDPAKDEWVCQIPIFPPFQKLADFDTATILRILHACIGLSESQSKELTLDILTTNVWSMHAQVADRFADVISEHKNSTSVTSGTGSQRKGERSQPRMYLVGDSAHRFPPAGGFGMNTGIQDAHNLAWKLALVTRGEADPSLLHTYHTERKAVAKENTALSMRNYAKSAAVARALGVDPSLASAAVGAASSSVSSFLAPESVRTGIVKAALQTGLLPLRTLRSEGSFGDVRVRLVERLYNRGDMLPLIFPKEDIDFCYNSGAVDSDCVGTASKADLAAKSDSSDYELPRLRAGARMPHCWVVGRDRIGKGSDAIGGAGPLQYVSTTELASLRLGIDTPTSEGLAVTQEPRVLLVVPYSERYAWVDAVGVQLSAKEERSMPTEPLSVPTRLGSVMHVVAIATAQDVAVLSSSCDNMIETVIQHGDLQAALQKPMHDYPGRAEGDGGAERMKESCDALVQLLAALEIDNPTFRQMADASEKAGGSMDGSLDDGDVVASEVFYDISGRWSETVGATDAAMNSKGAGKHGAVVAMRPDGHVAALADSSMLASVDSKEAFLQRVCAALRLK